MKRLITAVSVLLLFAAGAFASAIELDRVIAVVNKQVITWAELYKAMEFEYGQRLARMSNPEKRKLLKETEAKYLDRMIELAVQLQEAGKLGLKAEPAEVDAAVENIKKRYKMDDAAFREALKGEGFAYDDYRRRLAEQIVIGKLVSREVRDLIVVSEREAAEYAKQRGSGPGPSAEEEYHLLHVFIPVAKETEREEAMAKGREALARIKAGEDFETVARAYSSADPDLGTIGKGSLAPEFLNALERMRKGDVSEPFESGQGVHLLKLAGRFVPGDEAYSLEKARRELQDKRFEEQYASWLKGLKERSFIEVRL